MLLYIGVLIFFSLILTLWWYFTTARTEYFVDQTRQRFFSLREKLFDKAKNGELDFQSDAYGILRSTLNGQIRFCEDLTFIRFFIIILTYSKKENRTIVDSYTSKLDKALAKVSVEQKETFEKLRREMHLIMLVHIVETSLVLKVVLNAILLIQGLKENLQKLLSPFSANGKLIFVDAEAALLDKALTS